MYIVQHCTYSAVFPMTVQYYSDEFGQNHNTVNYCVRLSQQSIRYWSEQITSTSNCSCTNLHWRRSWLRSVSTQWRKWKTLRLVLHLLQLLPVQVLHQVPSTRRFSNWHRSTVAIVVLHLKILAKSFRRVNLDIAYIILDIAYIISGTFCSALNIQFIMLLTNTRLNYCNSFKFVQL